MRFPIYSTLLNLTIIVSLLLPSAALFPAQAATPAANASRPAQPDSGLFRTHITVDSPSRWARLEALGIVILERDDDSALVLVDGEQLEALAKLRFQPQASDELNTLLQAQGEGRDWLRTSMQPMIEKGVALQVQRAASGELNAQGMDAAAAELRTALHTLAPEQTAGLSDAISPDSDGDGLTDTEESWWCTDPMNQNSDGDAQGYTDGQEVEALLDVTQPRNLRWGYGPPFGPPNAWPNFNNRDGTGVKVCNDGDFDTIPDYAEAYMVGTRVPSETTDLDKFDDGQELFGITYCPGAPTNCGYGSYPAIEYWNFIKASIPNWVLPPGDSPFVAAFPVPEVYVEPGSWTVERVTTITTSEGEMAQTSNTYETAVTRGQSTSIADTVSWNDWEEVSKAVETPILKAQSTNAIACGPLCIGLFTAGATILVGGVAAPPAYRSAAAAERQVEIAEEQLELMKNDTTGKDTVKALNEISTYTSDLVDGVNTNNEQLAAIDSTLDDGFQSTNQSIQAIDSTLGVGFHQVSTSMDGVHQAIDQQSKVIARGLYDISYQISRPRYTETKTNGKSWGGAQTTTNEEYEEHTQSEGVGFTTGLNWSTAWAVDSSHAADLTFNYSVKNTGTEYAREVSALVFNIYIGDDKLPTISYPAWEQYPDGKLENLFPVGPNTPSGVDSERTFASTDIPLSLEQMKRIDLGERLTVKVESFSYGADELFYTDAVNGGVTVFIEDGIEDGDESVDSYVIPTWGMETVQDVLTRYFPHDEDVDGNINALWTPEFNGINAPTWNEHFLSEIAWWNVYLTQPDAGNTSLKDLSAQAGSGLLFRFNRDSDRDGYNDRGEFRYYCALPGTDPDHVHCADGYLNPAIHPQPEILAGYVTKREGDVVTALLVLENTGTFDAYGIDAVMYSPDDTTTIGNNTVGGNGRVRPGNQVAVGSIIQSPDLDNWGSSTSKPYAGGNYAGDTDRTYIFSVQTAGVVGQQGTVIAWDDGDGDTDTIDLGSAYHAPLPVDVSEGVQVGFNTGTIAAGASFTVDALTPRDTFTYTVSSESFTPPVIVVSYSDPQGSHRFITPVELAELDDSLASHTGEMLKGLRLEVVATGELDDTNSNTTNLIVTNPHDKTIKNGHLYLNFVSDGVLVLEQSHGLDIPAGPTVFSADWSVSEFSGDYNPDGDNILIAFWTDSENNIIDSAARPFDTFATDPRPAFAMAAEDEVWNFGEAQQGTLMQRTVELASIGYLDLLTYVGDVAGLSVQGPVLDNLLPGDMGIYTLILNTQDLSTGPFLETVPVRTSDPDHPEQTITIRGNITPGSEDDLHRATQARPDWELDYTDTHDLEGQISDAHTPTPAPETLQPVKAHSQDNSMQWELGISTTDLEQATASADRSGDGEDGQLAANAEETVVINVDVGGDPSFRHTSDTTLGEHAVSVLSQIPRTIAPESNQSPNGGDIVWDFGAASGDLGWEVNGWECLGFYGNPFWVLDPKANGDPWIVKNGLYLDNTLYWAIQLRIASTADTGDYIFWTTSNSPNYSGDKNRRLSITPDGQMRTLTIRLNDSPNWMHYITGLRIDPAADGRNGTCGGQSDVVSLDWVKLLYDDTAPAMSFTGPTINTWYKTDQNINWSVTDGQSGVAGFSQGWNDPGHCTQFPGATSGYMALSWAGDGKHTVHVRACDNSGRQTYQTAGWFGLDRVAPTNPKIPSNPGCTVSSGVWQNTCSNANFTWSGASDATSGVAGYYYYWGTSSTGVPTTWTTAAAFNPGAIPSGSTYYLRVKTKDNAGNISNPTTLFVLKYDSTPPANPTAPADPGCTASSGVQQNTCSDANFTWSGASDAASGVAGYYYYWGTSSTGAPTTWTTAAEFNPGAIPSGSTYYLRVKTKDNAGNVSSPATLFVLQFYNPETRFLRLSALAYADVRFSLQFSQPGVTAGPLAFTVDVGADGTVDWSYSGSHSFPAIIASPDLSAVFNGYLSGLSGEVDVPIRIVPSPPMATALHDFTAVPTDKPDASITSGDISFGVAAAAQPAAIDTTEGEIVPIAVTLHNDGAGDSGPLTVSFFATSPSIGGQGDYYIGADFVENVPAGGTATAHLDWNTLGFTGDIPVRVVVDPFDRLAEVTEANNEATTNLTILTLPDLLFPEPQQNDDSRIKLDDAESVVGQAVQIELPLQNGGQTAAGASTLALSVEDPDSVVATICESTPAVPGMSSVIETCTWTPTSPGWHRLYAVSDESDVVFESNEGNNRTWEDVYVGFAGPLLLDSGAGDVADPAYDEATGYGYLNGTASTDCGTEAEQSQRRDSSGKVNYRFDHLLPGHFYHLDVTLYECDGLGRQERILVDDENVIGEIIDLSSGEVEERSYLLDPALYANRSITVTVEELSGYNAVVSNIELHDIDYRYADAGGESELDYSAELGYGPLDGEKQDPPPWGTLPYQTRRIEFADDDLRYQFDHLDSDLRYQIHMTIYQGSGGLVQQTIEIDDISTGVDIELDGEQWLDDVVVDVPPGTYNTDGSIVVHIKRTNASAGAYVSEISLEQLTLGANAAEGVTQVLNLQNGGPNWISFNVKPPVEPATECEGVTSTSAFTTVYGDAILAGVPAPLNSIVEAYSPDGVKTGCFKVTTEGLYGYMQVYGAEDVTPGMQDGDPVFFKINGITATSNPSPFIWHDDKLTHEVAIEAPDEIPVEYLLSPIDVQYDKLLCENGTYLPLPADPRYNTCKTVEPGLGYRLYANAVTELPITGPRIAADTPLTLHEGWNWIGYLPTCELEVETALASISGSFDLLHNEIGTYRPPPANPAFNNFNTMEPGYGYMVHVDEAVTLTYPADQCGLAQANQSASEQGWGEESCPAIPSSNFTQYYGYVFENDHPLAAGSQIIAYSPRGEAVGCVIVKEEGLYPYMRVYGAEGDLPGMLPDEPVSLMAAGRTLLPSTPVIWQGDYWTHRVDLVVATDVQYFPMIR